jgi:hypothetical protein
LSSKSTGHSWSRPFFPIWYGRFSQLVFQRAGEVESVLRISAAAIDVGEQLARDRHVHRRPVQSAPVFSFLRRVV